MSNFLWVEKYRPSKVSECILPKDLQKVFQEFVDRGFVPNILMTGGPGVGKTTVARAMLNELGHDYLFINGSMNGNIDILRNDISQFASTVSLDGKRKFVILDEADYLNANSTQPALRSFMEEFSENCGFILTCNYQNKIIKELHSRCSVIDFKFEKSEKASIASRFFTRLQDILKEEGVSYQNGALVKIITKHFPDWRRIINEVQKLSVYGEINEDNVDATDSDYNQLIDLLKKQKFYEIRKWVSENTSDNATVYNKLLHSIPEHVSEVSAARATIVIADYMYRDAFVVDKEINLTACLTQLLIDIEWKN